MTTPTHGLPTSYRFADLTLDIARRSLTRHGQPIELKALDFDLLRFLIESAPNIVNADVLAEKVWGRHFVSPENVAQRVMLLRQNLSDDANKPRYIETVRNKGYRLVPVVVSVPAGEGRSAQRRRWLVWAIAAASFGALGLAAGAAYWLAGTQPRTPSSVAVLPFDNLSLDLKDANVAAVMQEELVNQLTQLQGLRVMPVRPGPGMQRAIPEIARDLNVATVLGGSVHYSEGRARVTARLTDGTTGFAVWSDSYELERSDILVIQRDIALDVARELRVELSAAERERFERAPTTHPRAHDLYIRSRTHPSDEVLLALDELEQALALDSAYIEAWVAYAHALMSAEARYPKLGDEYRRRGEEAARRAVELDPESGAAYHALGQALLTRNNWAGAEAAFRRAEELNIPPSRSGSYAFLQLAAGKFNAIAFEILEQVRAANPGNAIHYRFLVFACEGLGDEARAKQLHDDAMSVFSSDSREVQRMQNHRMHWLIGRKQFAEALAVPMDDPFNVEMLASLDAVPERALERLRSAYAANGRDDLNRYVDIGLWAGHFNDPALALRAMRAAADGGGGRMVYVWMPQLEAMRQLPEFKSYMREIGMVAYWQQHGWPRFCRQLSQDDFECN
jgi:DNA-binding winged helix-turn-helix (wHTH) protein/TolB-like protein